MAWPSLSVIVPSFNQGEYIERTLLSIIRQNYPGALQIIVSDGGSTDGTVDVLKKYPQVQWWSERDRGYVDAVTKGLNVATGEIIAIQSSDDFYLEGAFVKAIAVLQQNKDMAFVTGNEARIQEGDSTVYPSFMPYVTLLNPGALISRTPTFNVQQHCTFVRRSAVDRIGGLRESVDYCADFDLWYRVLHFGRAVMLPDYLAVYQIHAAQRTQNKAELWMTSLRKSIEDAEDDSAYAARFLPTPDMKRNILRQWEILWNRAAGGEAGLEKSRALADETLAQEDSWPDYVREFVQGYATPKPPPEPPPAPPDWRLWIAALSLKLRQNAVIRTLFGRHSLPPAGSEEAEELQEEAEGMREKPVGPTIDIDWWRPDAQEAALAPSAFETPVK